jgi:hypothetical protein
MLVEGVVTVGMVVAMPTMCCQTRFVRLTHFVFLAFP